MTEIALVSRSLAPFGGGGIGEYADATARLLSQLGHVTVFTTSEHEAEPRDGLAPGVEYVFVEEPEDDGGFITPLHRYASRVLDAIAERYPGGGPDLIEVPDHLGEGFVVAQARAADDPRVANAKLAVRLHTSAEMCSVLNGHYDETDVPSRATAEMERFVLRRADAVLWAGGDILGTYQRFYGADRLAPAVQIRHPLRFADPAGSQEGAGLLYLGRLERRKGVHNLVRALTALPGDWRLTLAGGDTDTAPLGTSMRALLEETAAGDERIAFLDHVAHDDVPALIARHDAVVMPSLWECWPYVALEALWHERPVLATPVGGLREIARPGWLAADTSAEALAGALERLDELPRDGLRDAARELAAEQPILDGYAQLLGRERPRPRPRRGDPLVTVVVPYWRMARFVEDTLRSIAQQTYAPIETLVVNDGSFEPEDAILEELGARYEITVLTQANAGLGAARNFGARHARGRYVLPLDSDNMLAPTYVERCVELLERRPGAAYATTWARHLDEHGEPVPGGIQPMGNDTALVERVNVAGDATALIRRELLEQGFSYSRDLTSFEDWELYVRLARAGHFGVVIPERLLLYRVRQDSMVREIGVPATGRLFGELQAHLKEREVQWT